jgi:hypothetical protein
MTIDGKAVRGDATRDVIASSTRSSSDPRCRSSATATSTTPSSARMRPASAFRVGLVE